MKKTEIVGELGEGSLLVPEYVNQALAANNRVKYYFTLLQAARQHADNPEMNLLTPHEIDMLVRWIRGDTRVAEPTEEPAAP